MHHNAQGHYPLENFAALNHVIQYNALGNHPWTFDCLWTIGKSQCHVIWFTGRQNAWTVSIPSESFIWTDNKYWSLFLDCLIRVSCIWLRRQAKTKEGSVGQTVSMTPQLLYPLGQGTQIDSVVKWWLFHSKWTGDLIIVDPVVVDVTIGIVKIYQSLSVLEKMEGG